MNIVPWNLNMALTVMEIPTVSNCHGEGMKLLYFSFILHLYNRSFLLLSTSRQTHRVVAMPLMMSAWRIVAMSCPAMLALVCYNVSLVTVILN